MMQTSIRDLKNHLSQYLRRAQRGEEIVVTSHNRPVAKLIPASSEEAGTQLSRHAWLQELDKLREDLAMAANGKPMSQLVVEMRDEERY